MSDNAELMKELRYQKRMRRCLQRNNTVVEPRAQNRQPHYLRTPASKSNFRAFVALSHPGVHAKFADQ